MIFYIWYFSQCYLNKSFEFFQVQITKLCWNGINIWWKVIVTSPSLVAPCTAGSVAANLDCYNSTAEVSWRPGIGASSYIVTAVGTDGFVASCATNEFHCNLTELQCGQVYNVTLTTVSEQCQIESYTNVSFGSREWFSILFHQIFLRHEHDTNSGWGKLICRKKRYLRKVFWLIQLGEWMRKEYR